MESLNLMITNSTDSFKVGSRNVDCNGDDNAQSSGIGSCICKNGYENVSRKCLSCSRTDKNKIGNGAGNGCICKNNYGLSGGLCVLCNAIDQNSIGDNAGGCKCKANYHLNKTTNKCGNCSSVYPNSTNDNQGGCKCNPGHVGTPQTGCISCFNFDRNSVPYLDSCRC